jgi:hypothetical protein
MGKRKESRWERRERKYKKRRYGMRVSGRSIKAVLLRLIGRKAKEAQQRHQEEVNHSEKGANPKRKVKR